MNQAMRAGSLAMITLMLCLGMMPVSATAQDYSPPDPEAAEQQALPDHDARASQGGKTATGHAEDLLAPTEARRLAAVMALVEMGVDALPARDAVRRALEQADDGSMPAGERDALRARALLALHMMEAPEAKDLWRAKILDPDFMQKGQSYADLLDGALRIAHISIDVLQQDLLSLGESAPEHAARLLLQDSIHERLIPPLQQAAFAADHDPEVTRFYLDHLSELDFLTDDQRVAYVVRHQDLLSDDSRLERQVLTMLSHMGTLVAFDAVMDLAPVSPQRMQLLDRFADGELVPLEQMLDRFMQEALAQETRADIDNGLRSMRSVTDRRIANAETSAERQVAKALYTRRMKDLMDGAPSTLHGTGALAAQMEFLTTHKVSDFTAVIDPLLAAMQDDSASADFKDTVSQVLNSSSPRMADLYGEAYLAHLMDLVWRSRDEEDAEGPGMMLWHVMRLAEHATVVVRLVAEDFDDHVTGWSMHPASALAIESGMTRGLERTTTRELASVVMGKAIASPVLDMDYLGPHLSRGGTPLFDLQQNTVAGVIALYEPTVFAGDKPESYPFPVAPYAQPMLAQPDRFASKPDEKAEWLAFLERVAALDDPDFSPVAETALASF